jgi:hypothetical protein
MAVAPWIVSDELWELVEPLLPKKERRFRYPGRKRLPDRLALQGILFVLQTGIARWTEAVPAPSTTSSSTRAGSRSPSRSPVATATTSRS